MKLFKTAVVLFLLFEICFSFIRYQHIQMDGDMPILAYGYPQVLNDPFGFNVVLHDSVYPAPNRYFAHLVSGEYLKNAPLIFQPFFSPVESVYAAWAFAKTAIQFLLIYLAGVFITGKKKIWNADLLFACALITPLFQIDGYHGYMGIIDASLSYTFFYAFALFFVMLFFLPFFNAAFQRRSYKFSSWLSVSLILLAVFIAFNGAVNPPVMLIICSFTLASCIIRYMLSSGETGILNKIMNSLKSIPVQMGIVFTVAICLCLYSLYIGTNNSENLWEVMPLAERYERLIKGIFKYSTGKIGTPLLIVMIIINKIMIKRNKSIPQAKNILKALSWFFWLALVYLFLLPLGGYRSYRPYIIRIDSLLPVTLGLILFYGLTTFHLLKYVSLRNKRIYQLTIAAFSLVYIIADAKFYNSNECEKNALKKIALSPEKIVHMDTTCSFISWTRPLNNRNSGEKMKLLQHWGIVKDEKVFYPQ